MQFEKQVTLKNGVACTLRSGRREDAQIVLDQLKRSHGQTDFLTSYPDENHLTVEQEGDFLDQKFQSDREIEILALVDGALAGAAGIFPLGNRYKMAHRADFSITVDQSFWGLGIGRALTAACIQCARDAGYAQLELEVVAGNHNAITLYESLGFREYGRNPKGFRSRYTGWQELVMMRLELGA